MEKLWFDSLPMEFFYGGVVGVTLAPYVGLVRLKFLEEIPVRFKHYESRLKTVKNLGDEVVLYVLHYGKYVKLGSSKASQAFSRMYSQAPIAGMVVSKLVVTGDNVDLESSLEKPLANKLSSSLRRFEITTQKKEVETLVNYLISGRTDQERVLNDLRSVSEASWRLLWGVRGSYALTTPPSEYWFTTLIDDESLEILRASKSLRGLPELRKTKCDRRFCRGTLTILHNAICVLCVESKNYVEYCDKVSYNLLIEVE